MIFGSVCSGIEAASTAWEPLGWKAAWFAEIEPFPSAVLAHHWPEVPNLGDFTKIRDRLESWESPAPEVLVGGTPCQAFSVAGLRQSMDDARGQLTLEFVRLANAIDTARSLLGIPECIVVWENVPGVLNTPDNAFGCFLGAMAGEDDPLLPPGGRWSNAGRVLGPSRAVAWRILDAQYFGVAQRRRRVFVVASARNGFDPTEILFEFDGMRRDSPPRREAGQGFAPIAGTLAANGGGLTRPAGNCNELDFCVPVGVSESPDLAHCLRSGASKADKHESTTYVVAPALNASGRLDFESEAFVAVGFLPQQKAESMSPMHMGVGTETVSTAWAIQERAAHPNLNAGPGGKGYQEGVGYTLEARHHIQAVATPMQVWRLTPTEAERLQGFPDGHTRIPWRGKPAEECPDGPRYKALGNSMAVPVMRWIGERIKKATRGGDANP